MRIDYTISGSFTVPERSHFLANSQNLICLPGGQVISVHPVIEMATSEEADDHRNLTYGEASALGVLLEKYDRDSIPW